MFDVEKIRNDFPLLSRTENGKRFVYFDNGATTQKPRAVIERIKKYYEEENANVHRGVYSLSARATENFEAARETVRKFLNAENSSEIIFTKGTTEAINSVASVLCKSGTLNDGDEIIVTEAEHHANIVPWQICGKKLILKPLPINDDGTLAIERFSDFVNEKTKLLAVTHVSNVTGIANDVEKLVALAKENGLITLIDGAQAVSHVKVDVQKIDCDFYVFSGHKIFAPTGIGVFYGKKEMLEKLPPYQGGGEMIDKVSFEETTFNELPYKFEAGTPNISGALGLAAALEYFTALDFNEMQAYEKELSDYAFERFEKIDGLKLIGSAKENRAPVFSFVIEGVHHYDLGTLLDANGIAIRTGHHCAQPLMKRFGVSGTARASLSFYNTKSELDFFFEKLNKAIEMLK